MRISLLMCTFDRPDALAATLRSIGRQTRPPDQVIIGDDGSGPETAAVIEAAKQAGLPITHLWREHDGFRLGRARNSCIAVASGEYLVIIDDDILLHPAFVADHEQAAERGFFVQGSRALLGEQRSIIAMQRDGYWPSVFDSDIEKRKNLLHLPWLARSLGGEVKGLRGIRGCNFGVWRDDVVRVNGFNEDFVGWGREDSEFVTRLFNAGVRRKNLRFAALGCHLFHPPRSRDSLEQNDALLAQTVDAGAVRCERGLNLHMDAAQQPRPEE